MSRGIFARVGGDWVPLPSFNYRGPIHLPGTGRMVWWTGRVAIGLRHEPPQRREPGVEMERIQTFILGSHR